MTTTHRRTPTLSSQSSKQSLQKRTAPVLQSSAGASSHQPLPQPQPPASDINLNQLFAPQVTLSSSYSTLQHLHNGSPAPQHFPDPLQQQTLLLQLTNTPVSFQNYQTPVALVQPTPALWNATNSQLLPVVGIYTQGLCPITNQFHLNQTTKTPLHPQTIPLKTLSPSHQSTPLHTQHNDTREVIQTRTRPPQQDNTQSDLIQKSPETDITLNRFSGRDDARVLTAMMQYLDLTEFDIPTQQEIVKKVGQRFTWDQIQNRWFGYLRPDLLRTDYSIEENRKLLKLSLTHYGNWNQIASMMDGKPKRTPRQVRTVIKGMHRKLQSLFIHLQTQDDVDALPRMFFQKRWGRDAFVSIRDHFVTTLFNQRNKRFGNGMPLI
jgi:hypothetical protein